MNISSEKVFKFQKEYPNLWHEGLLEKEVKDIKRRYSIKCPTRGFLTKFYWPKAKSYLFQDWFYSHIFCITKKYWDNL